ncbi:MAG: hypothetical protein C0602_01530 [Denitrovibrio sp.]|nr:MAG: hypothetical protein C0602_01530 [Denitrovibrio sp.]
MIKVEGRAYKGKRLLEKHLNGIRITRNEAIIAKCYDCEGGYSDGIKECNISDCPLHPYNPYNKSNLCSET